LARWSQSKSKDVEEQRKHLEDTAAGISCAVNQIKILRKKETKLEILITKKSLVSYLGSLKGKKLSLTPPKYGLDMQRKSDLPDLLCQSISFTQDLGLGPIPLQEQSLYDNWTLDMSSMYVGPQNTKEALLDNDPVGTGAGTKYTQDPQWISATLIRPLAVNSLELSGAQGMSGGWTGDYWNGREIQFLNSFGEWESIMTTSGLVSSESKTFIFPREVVSSAFRLFSPNSYVATGQFRLR